MEKNSDPGTGRADTSREASAKAAAEEAQETPAAGSSRGDSRSRKNGWMDRLKPILARKRLLAAAAGLIVVAGGLIFYAASRGGGGSEARRPPFSSEQALGDGLRQEDMPRFYIPLPPNSQGRVTVVHFSVVWDALSAMRFKKMESQVRDRLYGLMLARVGRGEDLQEEASSLEADMGRIFREALRTDNLAVRVREVRSH